MCEGKRLGNADAVEMVKGRLGSTSFLFSGVH